MSARDRVYQFIGGQHRCPLAASRGLMVYSVWEDVSVTDGTTHLMFGSMYGDADCAVISADQSWCAAGGHGIALARCEAGSFVLNGNPTILEMFTNSANTMWIAGLFTTHEPRVLGIIEEGGKLWQLDVDSLALAPWPTPQPTEEHEA